MIQATTRGQVLQGVQQYGLAPGARKMIDAEEEAAVLAMETGIYGVWRSSKGTDCTRIGPKARCFCSHTYAEHFFVSPKSPYPICKGCSCRGFAFVPSRPEEVGEWWLPRRKGFNVHTWRAKCRCGHGHDEHDPGTRRCRCGCPVFTSNFACLVCDLKWEEHETVFESATERLMAGRPVGHDFRPLADDGAMRGLVFPGAGPGEDPSQHATGNAVDSFAPCSLRRAQVPPSRGEKGVRIMAASSGGAQQGRELANRWGKVQQQEQDTSPGPTLDGGWGGGGWGGGELVGQQRSARGGLGGQAVGGLAVRGTAPAGRGAMGGMRPGSAPRSRPGSAVGGAGSAAGGYGSGVTVGIGGRGGAAGGSRPGTGVAGARPGSSEGVRPASAGRRPVGWAGGSGGAGAGVGVGMGGRGGELGRGTGGGILGRGGVGTGMGMAGTGGAGAGGPKQLSSGFRPVYD